MYIIIEVLVTIGLYAALMVIKGNNPVHSVLYLIVVFIASASILVGIGVEFIGIIYIVVYVGAVAVLFVFVVMMLNIRIMELNEHRGETGVLSFLIAASGFLDLYISVGNETGNVFDVWVALCNQITNISTIGQITYSYGISMFILGGCTLFLAMIATIVLTGPNKGDTKRQYITEQVNRSFIKTVVNRRN